MPQRHPHVAKTHGRRRWHQRRRLVELGHERWRRRLVKLCSERRRRKKLRHLLLADGFHVVVHFFRPPQRRQQRMLMWICGRPNVDKRRGERGQGSQSGARFGRDNGRIAGRRDAVGINGGAEGAGHPGH